MVEQTENKMIYVVGSNPVFAFNIRFFAPSEIRCYLGETELVNGVDFTIEAKNDYSTGANVTLNTGTENVPVLPLGKRLAIMRVLPFVQQLNLPEYGKLPSEPVEYQFDKIIMICQQLREEVERCVKVAVASGESPESVIRMILGAKDMALDSASTAASAAAACSSAQLTIATIWAEITGDSASAEAAIEALKEAWEAAGSVKAAAEAGKASVNEASLAAVEYAKGQIGEAQNASVNVLSATTKSRKEELLALIAETVGAEGTVAAAVQAAQEAAEAAAEETGKIESISEAAQASISEAVTVADQKKQAAEAAANEAATQAEAAGDSAAEAYSYIAQTLANKNAAEAAKAAAESAKADAQAAAGSASSVANASITAHNASVDAHPGTFVRCNGGGTVNGDLTLAGDGKGNLTASGTVKAGYMESSGSIKAANMETPGNVSAYTVLANRIWMNAPAATGACDVYGRDANGGNIGCFRSYTDANGVRAAVMIVYDAAGNNVGSLGISHESDGSSSSWLSVCNGRPTEIARCDWVQSQIASRASGAPGYPNFGAAVDVTSSYNSGWTSDVNGWLFVTQDATNQALWINGKMVSRYYEERNKPEYFGPVRVGDRIESATVGSADSYDSAKISARVRKMIFYPNA